MRALVLHAPGTPLRESDLPVPTPGPGQVLVELADPLRQIGDVRLDVGADGRQRRRLKAVQLGGPVVHQLPPPRDQGFEAAGPLAADRVVNIPRCSGMRDIADTLSREGVIDQPWLFIGGVLVLKAREDLKAG